MEPTPEKKTIIYVVEGGTGEYLDYRTWIVAAFKSKEKAEKRLQDATMEYERLYTTYGGSHPERDIIYYVRKGMGENKDCNNADPNMQLDYGGVDYCMYTITLED